MRSMAALTALALSSAPAAALAEPTVGAGVAVGEANGIALKVLLGDRHAVAAGIDYGLIDEHLRLHLDYLVHFGWIGGIGTRPGGSRHTLSPYVGIGGYLSIEDPDDDLGARVPLGLAWLPPEVPIDVFLEVAPMVALLPGTEVGVGATLGVRYYF
ncbi:MAG: hypothetical protein H6704_02470 [Myxococcales bacterium]|nr:hypothetical protein [Myxococcales bacterium]